MTRVSHFSTGNARPTIEKTLTQLRAIFHHIRASQAESMFKKAEKQIDDALASKLKASAQAIDIRRGDLEREKQQITTEFLETEHERAKQQAKLLEKTNASLLKAGSADPKHRAAVTEGMHGTNERRIQQLKQQLEASQEEKSQKITSATAQCRDEIKALADAQEQDRKDAEQARADQHDSINRKVDEKVKQYLQNLLGLSSIDEMGRLANHDYAECEDRSIDSNNLFLVAATPHDATPDQKLRSALTYILTQIGATTNGEKVKAEFRHLLFKQCAMVVMHDMGLITKNELDNYPKQCRKQFPINSWWSVAAGGGIAALAVTGAAAASAVDKATSWVIRDSLRAWTTAWVATGIWSGFNAASARTEGAIWRPFYHNCDSLMRQIKAVNNDIYSKPAYVEVEVDDDKEEEDVAASKSAIAAQPH